MASINKEFIFNYASSFKSKLVRNVQNYKVTSSSVIINLGMEHATICPIESYDKNNIRKLDKWQSNNFKNVLIKQAQAVLIVEDNIFDNPDFSNENTNKFPMIDIKSSVIKQNKMDEIKLEISEGKWEHISKSYPELKNLALWKTPENNIKIIDGFKFDPYFASGLNSEYDKSKEINFLLKTYIWFSPEKNHCGIHNQHPFIEFHTQLSGIGRMLKFTTQKLDSIYEEQMLSIGNSQSHTYYSINEIDTCKNRLQLSYPWHEYYAETDCIWLVSEFWPEGNK